MINNAEYLKEVRAQYEDYPYPYRDPEEERSRIIPVNVLELEKINYYCFSGKQDFNSGFRFLSAGCGTGDEVIYMAEQLRGSNAEVYALDMSTASLDIAKRRAEIRGLKNITWIHNSLLDLPNMDLEKFDFISCSGVLHHLEDPDKGLAALQSVLKDDGAIFLMLYAKYGRTGVYQMQELLRHINQDEPDIRVQIENAKIILDNLPEYNWYKHAKRFFGDMYSMGDIGIYDLFLHSQDRAYSVPELYEYVENTGMQLLEHASWRTRNFLRADNFIKDPGLLEKVLNYDQRTQETIAELMIGIVNKHAIYIKKQVPVLPSWDDLDNVPVLSGFPELDKHLHFAQDMANQEELRIEASGASFNLKPGKYGALLFKYLDGRNSIREIFAKVRAELNQTDLSDAELLNNFKDVVGPFMRVDQVFLRDKSVAKLPCLADIANRFIGT